MVPVEPGPGLVTDNGPGFLSKALEEYLQLRRMKHIVAALYHPQTNGKIERYHRTAKSSINLFTYESPMALISAMEEFVPYYNYDRYNEALQNVAPADVYYGKRELILMRPDEVKRKTLEIRKMINLSPT